MKTAIALVSWVFMLAVALAWGPALALDNALGLYYDDGASVDEIEISPNSTHTLYLILLNPVNENFDGGGIRDVDYVWGFECAIQPPSGDILLNVTFPTPTINIGNTDNIVAGFQNAVPVSGQRAAMLATFNVLTMGNNPTGYRLVPTVTPSIPNAMAYVDFDDFEDPEGNLVDMVPASGSHDRPVFTFGDYTLEQAQAWGAVKALYR
ncbi:MAG: hypothetical protein ACI9UK_001381 [Candidatus Krumholzibacteriia bacterium]|jgi:hypothetical protein